MGCFDLLKEQLNTLCPQLDVRENEPLERHTSLHIGGPAALMALPPGKKRCCASKQRKSWASSRSLWATGPTCWHQMRAWSALS